MNGISMGGRGSFDRYLPCNIAETGDQGLASRCIGTDPDGLHVLLDPPKEAPYLGESSGLRVGLYSAASSAVRRKYPGCEGLVGQTRY